jgi:hypothetical protein
VELWQALGLNDTAKTFKELNTLFTPLTSGATPTVTQTMAARAFLASLEGALTSLETLMATYRADVVDEVDSLLRGFGQKGLDRAIDTLLAADFEGFFSLDVEDSSYAGNLQKALRAVQKQDFPIRKTNRDDAQFAVADKTIAELTDVDCNSVLDTVNTTLKAVDISEPSSPNIQTP